MQDTQIWFWVLVLLPVFFAFGALRSPSSLIWDGVVLMYVGLAGSVFLPVIGWTAAATIFGTGALLVGIGAGARGIINAIEQAAVERREPL